MPLHQMENYCFVILCDIAQKHVKWFLIGVITICITDIYHSQGIQCHSDHMVVWSKITLELQMFCAHFLIIDFEFYLEILCFAHDLWIWFNFVN